jgi:cystathionine beta-lyase
MDFADLEEKASDERTKLLILCNPHNPAGRLWSREELARVYNICKEHGVIVVSDEIHNELTYRGNRYVPYGTVDEGLENAIVCTSPSKSFNTAGLQIANIICSKAEWREKIDRAINQNEVCDVNPFGVVALQAAYNESEEWLDQLCEYIYRNYEALSDFFAEHLPQLAFTPLEGTYLVWVDISATHISADELTERLLKEGRVQVNSGTMYDPACGQHFIRINIACPRSQMMEGLRRIAMVINGLTEH